MSDQIWTKHTIASAGELREHIERLMLDRSLAPGDRLPPVRTLADTLSLAPNTVAAAYRDLSARGLVVGRGRRGTFVAEHASLPAAEPAPPPGLVDLMSGNPDPELLPGLSRHLSPLADGARVLYGDPAVHPTLEDAARRMLDGDRVPASRLIVVSGALDGVERALAADVRKGDRVAVEAPGWPAVTDLVSAAGLRPVPVPVDDRGMVPHRLAEVAASVEAVVLTPRAQNPTGAAHDAMRTAELAAVLEPHPDVVVVEDDHAGLISGVGLELVGPGRRRWAYIQSMSKALGPDLRTAVMTGDDLTMGRVQGRQAAGPGWVSHLLQRLVASLLDDPKVAALLDRATAAYRQRRTELIDALGAGGVTATGRTGLNVWVPVADEAAVVAAVAAAGYAISAGERWRMGTPPAVRVSIGTLSTDDVAAVADALVAAVTTTDTTPTRRA